jgi:hypothetical protein
MKVTEGDRGGPALARKRRQPHRVERWKRAADPAQARQRLAVEGERAAERRGLRGGAQTGRVTLHEHRAAQQREPEQLVGAQLGVERRDVAGHERAERTRLGLLEARQPDCRERGRGDPCDDDGPAQRDDRPAERVHRETRALRSTPNHASPAAARAA